MEKSNIKLVFSDPEGGALSVTIMESGAIKIREARSGAGTVTMSKETAAKLSNIVGQLEEMAS